MEPEDEAVRQMVTRIDDTERVYNEEIEKMIRQQEEKRRAEEEMEQAQRLAEEKAVYLEQARNYAEQALVEGDDSPETRELLASIEKSEKARQEEIERIQREEEARIKAEEDAAKKDEEERALLMQAELLAGYLESAESNLDSGDFKKAREYSQKTLEVDPKDLRAQEILSRIDQAEQTRKDILEEEESKKRQDYIQNYLEKARQKLSINKFKDARKNVNKALELEKDNPGAMQMLSEIDLSESTYKEELEGKYGQKTRAQADKAVEEEQKKEEARKHADEKIRKDIQTARQYVEKGDYKKARRYAYKAWEKIPHDTEVAVLIADINKAEMFGPETILSPIGKDDPYHKYDEGKSWVGHIVDIFDGKPQETEEPDFGKVYVIDECVEIAIRNNQRMKVADEQVKLAEMRVWEKRRDLMPEATLRIERGGGAIGGFRTQDPGATRHYQGEKYQAEIKHTAFEGFRDWYEVMQTQANLEVIKLEKDKIRNEIIAETKEAYYTLDKAIKAVAVQGRIKREINRMYDIVSIAYERELIPRIEYLKVRGESAQIDYHYMSGQEDITLAEMILFQAMDLEPPDHRIRIEPLDSPERAVSIGLEHCYNLALANRSDFKIKEKTIEYYELERKMAKAKGWPKIELNGSFGKAFENFQPLDQANDWTGGTPRAARHLQPEWYAGVKTSIPFWGNTIEYNYVREQWAATVSAFRGSESATSYLSLKILDDLKYFTNLQEARVGFERSKYEYQKTRKDLLVEVKETYFKYRKALLHREVSKAKAEHEKQYIEVLKERQRFGEMELSRIAEEYEKLSENEYGVVQGDADYFIAIAKLNKAIGVPDYFDPWREDRQYEDWKGQQIDKERVAEFTEENTELEIQRREQEERKEKIAGYLGQAREELEKNSFAKARNFTIMALEVNANNLEARDLLDTVDDAEDEYRRNLE